MAPEEEPKPEISQQQAGPRPPGRRDRRPSRGRRGRGRGGRPKTGPTDRPPESSEPGGLPPREDAEPIFEAASDTEQGSEPASLSRSPSEPLPELAPQSMSRESREPGQPAAPATVEKAIEEVSAVVESLRTALDEMEEVLELLEVFERQKNADEREIEALRRAVRQVNRPRDTGHHHHGDRR